MYWLRFVGFGGLVGTWVRVDWWLAGGWLALVVGLGWWDLVVPLWFVGFG